MKKNENRICIIEGCDRPFKAHGYCNTHNEQIRRHGYLLDKNNKVTNKDKTCKVEGCNSPVLYKDYCSRHYQQQWKYGEIRERKAKPKKENKDIELYKDKEWLNKKYNIELLDILEIAQLADVNTNTINSYLNKYKIGLKFVEDELHSRSLYKTKRLNNISNMKEYLIEEYVNNKKSSIEIGNHLNLNPRKIISWMKLFNIKRRGNTEVIQERNSKNISPTNKQWQVILGSWMGDGSIRRNSKNAHFRLTHCEEQYEYLKYKRSILEENNLLWFSESKRIGGGYSKEDGVRYSIESQCTPLLNDIYEKCYTNGKANFNIEYINQIDDYGLYIWYLDDGSLLPNNTVVFCTDNFTYEDNVFIQKYFLDNYSIETKIFTVPGLTEIHYRQRINPSGFDKFIAVIDKYKNEVESMEYKLEKR